VGRAAEGGVRLEHRRALCRFEVHGRRPSAPHAARVSAAEHLLNRGWGKPPQSVEHSGRDGGPIETRVLTDIEAARRIAWLLGNAAEAGAESAEAAPPSAMYRQRRRPGPSRSVERHLSGK
jgi:hypothetical protein